MVLANPPFGGKERKEVQQNFPIRTGETAFLFLQHFIKMLKAGGRAGVVIKNTFLSNTDNASVSLRKLLLESCNLHTVLDCPGGTFQGAGVKTVVLFFEKGAPTRKVWFYQLDPGRNLGKTNPLNDDDLAEFVKLQKTFADSPKSWTVDAKSIDQTTFDLSVKNPNGGEEVAHRSPQEIMDEIAALDAESAEVLGRSGGCYEAQDFTQTAEQGTRQGGGAVRTHSRADRQRPPDGCPRRRSGAGAYQLRNRAAHCGPRTAGGSQGRVRQGGAQAAGREADGRVRSRLLQEQSGIHAPVLSCLSGADADCPVSDWAIIDGPAWTQSEIAQSETGQLLVPTGQSSARSA